MKYFKTLKEDSNVVHVGTIDKLSTTQIEITQSEYDRICNNIKIAAVHIIDEDIIPEEEVASPNN